MKLTDLAIQRIKKLRYHDGLTRERTAEIVGCSVWAIHKYAPGKPGKVPNDKLRAAFERSGLGAQEVARRLGWTCRVGSGCIAGDGSRVNRMLGLTPDVSGRGLSSTRRFIDAETAGLMAEALGLMPWEVMPDESEAA